MQGIDLPAGSVVFPVGHHATMRAAILIDDSGRRISAQELESLPSFEQVERGWLAALRVASRVDVPEASWANVLTTQRCNLLLGAANSRLAAGDATGETEDAVDLILDRAERVKLGDKPSEWIDEVATATESIIRRCAKNRTVQWFEQRAILSASMVLHRAGETRGQHDIAQAWSRLLGAVGGQLSAGADITRDGLTDFSGVRQIAWIESQLVAQRHDDVIEICPRGIDASWLGTNFECHKLVASPEHLISFAVRWHGEKPALLWEIDGPIGARVAASAVDQTFSSTEMRGETLLTGFAAPQTAAMK